MKLLELLRGRSSANSFSDEPIPQLHLESILEATSYSPRAANLQHFSIRALNVQSDLTDFARVMLDCKYLSSASAALIFFVDLKSTSEWFKSEGASYPFLNMVGYHYGLLDSALALQSSALVAEELGYSTRVLSAGLLRATAVAQFFSCPQHVVPSLVLTIGKEGSAENQRRHNPDWRAYTSMNVQSEWKTWKDVYVSSGKSESELNRTSRLDSGYGSLNELDRASVPKALTRNKYRTQDLEAFAKNLEAMLERALKS